MKAWEFIKKWKIIPYVIMMLFLAALGLGIRHRNYSQVVELYGNDAIYLKKYYLVILIIALIAATVLYYMVFIRKSKLHNILLAAILSVGTFVMVLIPPFASADEDTHLNVASYYANMITGVGDAGTENNLYYKRACDAEYGTNHDMSAKNYIKVAKDLFTRPDENGKKIVIDEGAHVNMTGAKIVIYLPAVVGVMFSRLIGVSTTMMVFICRILMLAVYATLCYLAIRKIPTGKNLLMVIMLLPSSLMRAGFVSEEAVIDGALFLFMAYVVNAAFTDRTIKVSEAVTMGICGALVTFGKGGAYIPLLLTLFIIPKKNFGSKIKYPVIVAGAVILTGILFVLSNPSLLGDVVGNNTDLYYTEAKGYSLGHIISHPKESCGVLVATWLLHGPLRFTELTAGNAGYLQIPSSSILVGAFVIVMLLAVMNTNGEELCYSRKQKTISIVGALCSAALVVLSMWLFYTPMGEGAVIGLQGRYFLPLLFPVLMVFKNKTLVVKKDIGAVLIFTMYLLYFEMFMEIWFKLAL